MRPRGVALQLVLCALGAGSGLGCGTSPTDPEDPEGPAPNFITLRSDAGDYVGLGQTYEYSQANAVLAVNAQGGNLFIEVQGDERWTGVFVSPEGHTMLQPGSYPEVTRYPFHDPTTGGFTWSGEGRGCSTIAGSVTIDSLTYAGSILSAIALRFQQFCEGGPMALHGTIHWRADDATAPPGPVTPTPTTLWHPAIGATPGTGNYVYLTSEPGDFIGQGQTVTYTPADATLLLTGGGSHLQLLINGHEWQGDFQGMIGLDQLEIGYYGDLQRHPFHNPARGGMQWSGQFRGCNRVKGWFAVDHIAYSSGVISAIDLRFQQHCEGMIPALRGAVRWRAP